MQTESLCEQPMCACAEIELGVIALPFDCLFLFVSSPKLETNAEKQYQKANNGY